MNTSASHLIGLVGALVFILGAGECGAAESRNALGVARPPKPTFRPPAYGPQNRAAVADYEAIRSTLYQIERSEAHAENMSRAGDWGAALQGWANVYDTAAHAATTEPRFYPYALYAGETMLTAYRPFSERSGADAEQAAVWANGLLEVWWKYHGDKEAKSMRARWTPPFEKFVGHYVGLLREAVAKEADWPGKTAFELATSLRETLSKLDPAKAKQFSVIDEVYVEAVVAWIQKDIASRRVPTEHLGTLVKAVEDLAREGEGKDARAVSKGAVEAMSKAIAIGVKLQETEAASRMFRAALPGLNAAGEGASASNRALLMAIESEAMSPGAGQQLFEILTTWRREQRGEQAFEKTFEELETYTAEHGIGALAIIARSKQRQSFVEAGNKAEALALDVLTVEQCLEALRSGGDGQDVLAQGASAAAQRIGEIHVELPAGALDPTQVTRLVDVSRVYVARRPAAPEARALLEAARNIAAKEQADVAVQLRAQVALARLYSSTEHTDAELLDAIREAVLAEPGSAAAQDAVDAEYLAACSAENHKDWPQVRELVERALKTARQENGVAAPSTVLELQLLLAQALRHIEGPAGETTALAEAIKIAAKCPPEVAEPIVKTLSNRLRKLKQLDGAATTTK